MPDPFETALKKKFRFATSSTKSLKTNASSAGKVWQANVVCQNWPALWLWPKLFNSENLCRGKKSPHASANRRPQFETSPMQAYASSKIWGGWFSPTPTPSRLSRRFKKLSGFYEEIRLSAWILFDILNWRIRLDRILYYEHTRKWADACALKCCRRIRLPRCGEI